MNLSRLFLTAVAASLLAALLPSCSKDPKQEAAEALKARNYTNTVDDFLMAAATGDLEAMDEFAVLGMNINSVGPKGATALHRAVGAGRTEIVRYLLQNGASADIPDQAGRIPLVQAADTGAVELVELLLPETQAPELKDNEGWGALTIASFNAHSKAVKVLAPKLRSQLDDALLVACFRGDVSTIGEILNNGAYINTRSPGGQTPLMIAAENGHLGAVKHLLKNKANPYAVDEAEQTAANLAGKGGHAEIRDLLLSPTLIAAAIESTETDLEPGENPAAKPVTEVDTLAKTEPQAPPSGKNGKPVKPALRAVPAGSEEEEAPAVAVAKAGSKPLIQAVPVTGDSEAAAPVPPAATPADKAPTTVAATPETSAPAKTEAKPAGNVAVRRAVPRRAVKPLDGSVIPHEATWTVPVSASTRGTPKVTRTAAGVYTAKVEPAGVAKVSDMAPTQEGTSHETRLSGIILEGYHERSLPVILKGVNNGTAEFRVLSSADDGAIQVPTGDKIPGTPFRVKTAAHHTTEAKMGKGQLVDVSRATVVDDDTGVSYDLVKDIPGQSGGTYAILRTSGTEDRYMVKPHDRFVSSLTGKPEQYEVIDVRPTQVIIRQESSQGVITIDREGMVMR